MKLFALLFSVILYADLTAAASMKKDLSQVNTTKSSDLVSLLQEDLRKNNDDYKDVLPNLGDGNDAIQTKLQNPYLLDKDAILTEAENTGDNKLGSARRGNKDERKSTDKTQMSTTTKTRTNDKDVVLGTGIKKDIKNDNNDGKNKNIDSKNIKTLTEKVKNNSYEKFIKNHRVDKPGQSDKKENLRQDIKNKKDERTTKLSTSYVATKAPVSKMWKTHEESKMKNKNLMLHDKNMKVNNKNMKFRFQDTRMDDKKHLHSRKSLDFDWGSKASREGEVMDPTTERSRHLRNDSRRGSLTNKGAKAKTRTNALHAMLDQEGLLNKFLKQIGREGARAFELESDIEATTPAIVASAELDMLPATGERVETLRRKGRFCFRHVLFPEGPKYDSRGRIYEPAHEKKIDFQDFASTKMPKQVLPRCCNCCKKSVLGCE